MTRKLTAKDVRFVLRYEPEHIPVEGNALASGDDRLDRKAERWIYRQLDAGNEWAWCTVVVEAHWEGLTGTDCLGGCSYRSEKDFRKGGYYEDMKAVALADLQAQVDALADAIATLG